MAMPHVVAGLAIDGQNMRIIEGVEDPVSLTPGADQFKRALQTQLV